MLLRDLNTLPFKIRGRWRGLLVLIIFLALILWYDRATAPSSPSLLQREGGGEFSTPTTTLLAVGDIMLSRHVGAKIDQTNNPNLPFEKLIPILQGADITFGNLECPLSDSNIPLLEGLVFRCLTKHFGGVINASFDVLSTANNHSFDQGSDNINFTIDYLRAQNILPAGTTSSLSPPREGEMKEGVIERNGIRFGFLAYSYSARNDGRTTTDPQIATMDIKQMQNDITELKSRADIIIVSMHAGTEYTRSPNQQQIKFAHAAIEAGADIIIGHHPHWIQEIEIYSPPQAWGGVGGEVETPSLLQREGRGEFRKGLIFYSLGNFVFDQMWSQETREGLMVKFQFQGTKLKSYELMPIIIDNSCCPRLATAAEKSKILKKINHPSEVLKLNAEPTF